MKHYEYQINLFVDGELPKGEHKELFVHLAGCDECGKALSDYYLLKERSREFCSQNISHIKNKPSKQNIFYKVGFYTSTAAAVILLVILFTSRPAQTYLSKNEVRVDTVFVQKEVSFTQNQIAQNNSLIPGKKELVSTSQQEYLRYVMDLRTEVFTQADLIKSDSGSIQ